MAETRIRVDLARQRLELLAGDEVRASYPISSAANGAGEADGSEKTPRGLHTIAEKIGADAPDRAVFVGREPTGEICDAALYAGAPERDWILTRILWLDGLEPGKNHGPGVDSHDRYIYIHGTAEEERIGTLASHGCIRMCNADVCELFDQVEVGTLVEILEGKPDAEA
ncbi:MAG: L,D-transpeptidase [Myxococcota bacterium]